MLGLLEAREASARERVEVLREEASRAAAALETGEIELDRRVIAREELVEALAASAAETTPAAETEDEDGPVPVPAAVPVVRAVVPTWRAGLLVSVLSPDNQRILNVLQDRPGQEPLRAKDIAAVMGIDAAVVGVRTYLPEPVRGNLPGCLVAAWPGPAVSQPASGQGGRSRVGRSLIAQRRP